MQQRKLKIKRKKKQKRKLNKIKLRPQIRQQAIKLNKAKLHNNALKINKINLNQTIKKPRCQLNRQVKKVHSKYKSQIGKRKLNNWLRRHKIGDLRIHPWLCMANFQRATLMSKQSRTSIQPVLLIIYTIIWKWKLAIEVRMRIDSTQIFIQRFMTLVSSFWLISCKAPIKRPSLYFWLFQR